MRARRGGEESEPTSFNAARRRFHTFAGGSRWPRLKGVLCEARRGVINLRESRREGVKREKKQREARPTQPNERVNVEVCKREKATGEDWRR